MQFAQLRQLAKKNSVHFIQVKTDNRKDRPGSQGLTINGRQADVNHFKDDLNAFVATISTDVTSRTVRTLGTSVCVRACMSACVSACVRACVRVQLLRHLLHSKYIKYMVCVCDFFK